MRRSDPGVVKKNVDDMSLRATYLLRFVYPVNFISPSKFYRKLSAVRYNVMPTKQKYLTIFDMLILLSQFLRWLFDMLKEKQEFQIVCH